MLINDKWGDIHPGNVHFNAMGKVRALRHTGGEPLVVLSIFTKRFSSFSNYEDCHQPLFVRQIFLP